MSGYDASFRNGIFGCSKMIYDDVKNLPILMYTQETL